MKGREEYNGFLLFHFHRLFQGLIVPRLSIIRNGNDRGMTGPTEASGGEC